MTKQQIDLDFKSGVLTKLHKHLQEVGRFPHAAQAKIIKAFFKDKKKVIQGQCGRSLGKTEAILYITWRFALTNPGTETYIVCPELAQARKIYWIPKRLQNYGPQEFVLEDRDSELRVVFKNGSYIILAGCENYEALRGIKPNLVVYDEFQHHTQFFDEEVMQPNLSSGKVSLIAMGTPPKRHCYYVEFRDEVMNEIARGNKNFYYAELHSEENPTLDKEWLKDKRDSLMRKGKINVYLREYEGKLVFDTEHAVFPFFDDKPNGKHVKPAAFLDNLIKRDKKKLIWYDLYDPGTATCFAGLFIAVNPYTSQVFILDEIYAQEKQNMTAKAIWETATEIRKHHYANEDGWLHYYDEAETWFANEIQQLFDEGLIPTRKQKAEHKKTHDEGRAGESLLNTLMLTPNKFFVSDKCKKFVWEIINYVTDEMGKYPRKHDHLMDLLFYFIQNANVQFYEDVDPAATPMFDGEEIRRPKSIEQAIEEKRKDLDHTHGMEPDYYDYLDEESWR